MVRADRGRTLSAAATQVLGIDHGPLARLQAVIEQPDTMDVIVQRLTDGEKPESLKEIALAWQVPYGRLAAWITEDRERAERYSTALRFAAETFVHEAVPIADAAAEDRDAVAKAKLRIDTRLKIAGKWDRAKYGESTEVKHTGAVSLIAVLSSLPRGARPALDVTPPAELPAPAEPENVEPAKAALI